MKIEVVEFLSSEDGIKGSMLIDFIAPDEKMVQYTLDKVKVFLTTLDLKCVDGVVSEVGWSYTSRIVDGSDGNAIDMGEFSDKDIERFLLNRSELAQDAAIDEKGGMEEADRRTADYCVKDGNIAFIGEDQQKPESDKSKEMFNPDPDEIEIDLREEATSVGEEIRKSQEDDLEDGWVRE